jgi:Ner family transcriptional regulator
MSKIRNLSCGESSVVSPTDILCLVWKKGWSLNQLAKDAGVSRAIVSLALRRPNPRGERVLIEFLGVPGHKLWPDRYAENGERLVRVGRKPQRGKAA